MHGDKERRLVVALRIGPKKGASMPMKYRWYYKGVQIGRDIDIPL